MSNELLLQWVQPKVMVGYAPFRLGEKGSSSSRSSLLAMGWGMPRIKGLIPTSILF